MQRIVDVLGATDNRVIVSKGPLSDQIRLHDNMTGEGFLPQPAIVPLVDLVITHGGNNTVTEAFHHGKPMVVLPLFWDQVDNAQRIYDLGFGIRLDTYAFEPYELTQAVDWLVVQRSLDHLMDPIARRIQAAQGTVRAADLIERLAATGSPC
jgi:UDP:flavonoid glycosyltransferase YjiC (YdhE family)